MKTGKSIVFMGVSGTGKSSVGAETARRLGLKFIDGDDLHPKANIIKMGQGLPLNDDDRLPWLERIRDAAFSLAQKNESGIIVCSALKKHYRDLIRSGNAQVHFLFLHGSFALILSRMRQRQGHFMKSDMLQSQFDTLEWPLPVETDITPIAVDGSVEEVVHRCIAAVQSIIN